MAAQGDVLTAEQYAACEELGILVDKDDMGVLMQIFTKPLGDRWGDLGGPAGASARGRGGWQAHLQRERDEAGWLELARAGTRWAHADGSVAVPAAAAAPAEWRAPARRRIAFAPCPVALCHQAHHLC